MSSAGQTLAPFTSEASVPPHDAKIRCDEQEKIVAELEKDYAQFSSELLRLQRLRTLIRAGQLSQLSAYTNLRLTSGLSEADIDQVDQAKDRLDAARKRLKLLEKDIDLLTELLQEAAEARGLLRTADLGPSRYFDRGPLPYVHRFTVPRSPKTEPKS